MARWPLGLYLGTSQHNKAIKNKNLSDISGDEAHLTLCHLYLYPPPVHAWPRLASRANLHLLLPADAAAAAAGAGRVHVAVGARVEAVRGLPACLASSSLCLCNRCSAAR